MNDIRQTLEVVRQRLNEFIRAAEPRQEEWVVLSNLVNPNGTPVEATRGKLVMFLAGIQKETVVGMYEAVEASESIISSRRCVDLCVLLVANFYDADYADGLGIISRAISFFQQHPTFTNRDLGTGVEKLLRTGVEELTWEMINLDPLTLSQLMGMAGIRYLPSACYRVRMLPLQIGVATAVPTFVGYTQRAERDGKSLLFEPVCITSIATFEEVFGRAYKAAYEIVEGTDTHHDFSVWDPTAAPAQFHYYRLECDHRFNLYNSMRLFYANGGGDCFVVSVGLYETPVDEPPATTVVGRVTADDLTRGLTAAQEWIRCSQFDVYPPINVDPTMLVVPDAVLLPPDNPAHPWISAGFARIAQSMLAQCETLRDRVAILDVYGTQYLGQPAETGVEVPDLATLIAQFRNDVGGTGLSYGTACFPFLHTTVVPLSEVDYTSIGNTALVGDAADVPGMLVQILTWENQNLYGDPAVPANTGARQVLADITRIPTTTRDTSTPEQIRELNDRLAAALPLLVEIERLIVNMENVLPPSAAMAGLMKRVDSTRGVWNSPANYPLSAVTRPSFPLDNGQQGDLNMPVDGKAIHALREFPGRGTVAWGGRTLDGNSNDYRSIQVRRTLIYIEQSIKLVMGPFVFAPNTGQTWATVVSIVSSFLRDLWSRGGLMGATASEAFSVDCGLGSTMTGKDVLDGYMIVHVFLAFGHPEFIELTFKQTMESAA